MQILTFPERKTIRARFIADYITAAGYTGAVVFTCGHAATALRKAGVDVVEVSPGGDLQPGKWWTLAEIHNVWPHLFDATCGHLPAPLMVELAGAYREYHGDLLGKNYNVPTGSGETIICLRWAYPGIGFMPVYGDNESTRFNDSAPLNLAVGDLE